LLSAAEDTNSTFILFHFWYLSRVEDFAVADIDIQIATENGRLYQLEDIQELKRSQVISKSSAHLQICARVLENNPWKKTNLPGEGSCVTRANPVGFEIIMRTTTGESINCRAEVSGMIGEDEFLQNIQAGELECLLLGFAHQTFRQFLMIVERRPEGTVRRVGIMSVILPRQDLNLSHGWTKLKDRRTLRGTRTTRSGEAEPTCLLRV
jgi:hypothetical protein